MKKKEQSVSIEHWCHTKPRRFYDGLKICSINVEPLNILLAASVIDQNNMIKATSQEVVEYDFSDETTFELNWE